MAKKRSSGTGMGVLAVFGVVAVVAGLAVLVAVRAQNKPQTRVVKGVATAAHVPLRGPTPLTKQGIDFAESGDPLLADVTGDHVDELIVYEGGGYAAIDTRNDDIVWRTSAVAPPSLRQSGQFAWVAGDAFVVSRGLDVKVFSLKTGMLRATYRLADQILRPCASAPPAVARVSLASGDLDLSPNDRRTKATGPCLPVDTDGLDIAYRGGLNRRSDACGGGAPDCRKRLPTTGLPAKFAALEAQWTGSKAVVLGVVDWDRMLVGVDGKRAVWSTPLTAPTPRDDLTSTGGSEIDRDPALVGWQASSEQVLLFRGYRVTSDPSEAWTSIQAFDAITGEHMYLQYVRGVVHGVRFRDPVWVVTTRRSAWEIGVGGSVRLLVGTGSAALNGLD